MATRPVFVPDTDTDRQQLVHEHEVDFQWAPGQSVEQKKVNISKLHAAAKHRNLDPLLEVSLESPVALGVRVASSNLAVNDDKAFLVPLPAAYHGSKVFTEGGPYADLYVKSEQEIAADSRLVDSGKLAGFRFSGLEWGVKSGTMFYDWLTVKAIHRNPNLGREIRRFMGFTDIVCRMNDDQVCHARSCALYVALVEKKLIDAVIADQTLFIQTLQGDSFYQR